MKYLVDDAIGTGTGTGMGAEGGSGTIMTHLHFFFYACNTEKDCGRGKIDPAV